MEYIIGTVVLVLVVLSLLFIIGRAMTERKKEYEAYVKKTVTKQEQKSKLVNKYKRQRTPKVPAIKK